MRKLFIIFIALGAYQAPASQDQAYGLGDKSAGRVGSVTAEAENPYAALYNPALLTAQPHSIFSFTTASAVASFSPLKNVRLASNSADGRAGEVGDFRLPDSRLSLWAVGYGSSFELPRWMDDRHGGFGLTLSGPFERLRTYSASTPQDFFPLRYGTSDAQFKATLSGAIEIFPETLSFGAGMSMYIVTGGSAEVALTGDNPTGRMALDVGMRATPIAGLFFEHGDTAASLVFREAIDPVFQQAFSGTVRLGGDSVLQQPVLVRTSLYYEPRLFESDLQHDFGFAKLSVGAAYQEWKQWKPAFLMTETPDASGRVHRTNAPTITLKNTVSPRASLEVPLYGRRLVFSTGYQFRPSPVVEVSGAANPLDTDTHVVGASFRHTLGEVEWLPFELSWGLYVQYHWMKSRTVTKTADISVGSPGYTVNGRAYTFGISLGVDL